MICERCGSEFSGNTCWKCQWKMNWGDVHEEEAQVKKIKRALDIPPPLNLNLEHGKANFSGSKGQIYDTTLFSCTCIDFMRGVKRKRPLPCKHIYRLAIECGLMELEIPKKSRLPAKGGIRNSSTSSSSEDEFSACFKQNSDNQDIFPQDNPEAIIISTATEVLPLQTFPPDEETGCNKQQQAAVTCEASDILILAGAGTGKTKTIVARVAHLIQSGIDPKKILLMTFTRRAAREMIQRIETLVGEESSKITAGTFHHFCLLTMRQAPHLFDFKRFVVIDQDDAENLFKLARAEVIETPGEKFFPNAKDLINIYSYARNTDRELQYYLNKYTTFDEETQQKCLKVFTQYETLKRKYNYIDFDDILCHFVDTIHSSETAMKHVKRLFDHILVDEMQDTNPVQWKIIEGLRDPAYLFCVGDDAQSIYSFRGADFKNVHSFADRIPGGTILKLEENYRSTQEILDLSNWLLKESPLQYNKELHAHRGNGITPQLVECENEFSEARWITGDLRRVIGNGTRLRDIMILTRTAWRSRAMETELIAAGIPYFFIGGLSITKAAHVKDVFSLLRVSLSTSDRLAWLRYLMLWKGIGEKWASKAFFAVNQSLGLDEALEIIPKYIPPTARSIGISEHISAVRELREKPREAMRVARECLEECMSTKYDNWEYRSRDLKLLEEVAERYGDVDSFLETYTLDPLTVTQITAPQNEDALTLITIHSAKGTEATNCYVLGVEPGQFPHFRSMGDPEEVEEERRILYVAMTRAKNKLVLTRNEFLDYSVPYFLKKMPKELCIAGTPEKFTPQAKKKTSPSSSIPSKAIFDGKNLYKELTILQREGKISPSQRKEIWNQACEQKDITEAMKQLTRLKEFRATEPESHAKQSIFFIITVGIAVIAVVTYFMFL